MTTTAETKQTGVGHTPGPWSVLGRVTAGLAYSAVGGKTLLARVYSEAYRDVAEEEANARLIAAAPDLLTALAALIADHDDTYDGEPMTGEKALALEAGRAALSKAEGRTT